MEQIDDDLILEAAAPRKKTFPLGAVLSAAAACLILAISCALLLPKPPEASSDSPRIQIKENVWQREDFQAYSLSYRTNSPALLNCWIPTMLANDPDALSTQNLSISSDVTIKFETLIAQRYAVFYSDTGYPVFYDTQEDRQIDLQERILGDTNSIFIEHAQAAEAQADLNYPGMLRSETNRRLFWEYLYAISRNLPLQDIVAKTPDTDFMNELYDWYDKDPETKKTEFWSMCWSAYVKADTDLYGQLYNINILGIDAANGQCILRANDLYGNGCDYLVYDIKTDTCSDLPDGDSLHGTMQTDGYIFHFSADGTIATVAYPDAGFSGGNLYLDLTHRFTIPSKERYVSNYQGENLGVFFLKAGKAQKLSGAHSASNLLISDKNHVLYYKQIEPEQAGKSFHASDAVWFNRLNLHNQDTDHWVFHTVTGDCQVSYSGITLQGNFVRFAANETIVIMERGGVYYAYSLTDGSDVTEAVKSGQYSMYAHELMQIWLDSGKLYRKDLFSDAAAEVICEATQFALSEDGAFLFVYSRGQRHVTCYNVASLESCNIAMEPELCDQFLSDEGAVLQMNYNPEENTLLLSYYFEADQNTENTSDIDLFRTLAQLRDKNPDNHYPDQPVVVTDITISDEIMDLFRDGAYQYLHPDGVISWEKYYPEILDIYEDLDSICEKLGLDISTTDLDINGTQFILYQDDDETLTLTFYQFWGLFDYNDHNAGFEIRYNGSSVVFSFLAPDGSDGDTDPGFTLPFEIPPAQQPGQNVAMPQVQIPTPLPSTSGKELFTPEIMSAQPTPLSDAERERIAQAVEDLLAKKNYSTAAQRLIRDSVEQLCYSYASFQTMFAFVNVPDAQTYIQEAVLDCLDTHVHTICFPCQHSDILDPAVSDGRGIHEEWTLHITMTNDASVNAAMLMKALGNVRTTFHRYAYDNLIGSYSMIHMMTMTNSQSFQYLNSYLDSRLRIPENSQYTHYLQFNQYRYSDDDEYPGNVFRLLALTDYETIESFMQNADEWQLEDELIRRYGSDGTKLFDLLMKTGSVYSYSIEAESLFLKHFVARLEEVKTPEEMASYLQLYRLYRKLFSVQYVHFPSGYITEQAHPLLDYEAADLAVAQAAIDHGIFNSEAIPADLLLKVVQAMISRPSIEGSMYYGSYAIEQERLLSLEPVLLYQSTISVHANSDGSYIVYIHSYPRADGLLIFPSK